MKYLQILILFTIGIVFFPSKIYAQEIFLIEGVILSKEEKLSPIPGVNVVVYDKNRKIKKSVLSDEDGKFQVEATSKSSIEFSFLGYITVKKVVTSSVKNLVIEMSYDTSELNTVVVVGYQDKRKALVTGATVVIDAKQLKDIPVANVMELLQGKVPGLNIQNNNGTPGAAPNMILRGISNINVDGSGDEALLTPTSPLFVIDGIPVNDPSSYQYGFQQAGPGISPLSLIPVEDIAEIQILKDASSTSLYGSRGAYGVILIKTKRGQSNVPIISYSNNFFISTAPSLRDVIVGRGERMSRINQILNYNPSKKDALELINSTSMLSDSLNVYYNNATDWQKIFYKTTYNQSHNISFSGGDDLFNYKANGGYYQQNGIVKNTGFTRYSLSTNMGYRPNSKFSLTSSVNTSLGVNSKGSGNSLAQNGIASAGNTSSLLPSPSIYTASNATLGALSIKDDNKTVSVSTNVDLSYEVINGVRLSSALGYSYSTGTSSTFSPAALNNENAKLVSFNSITNSLYFRNSVSYYKTLKEKHNFNVFFFQEVSLSNFKNNSITLSGLPNDKIWGPIGSRDQFSSSSANPGAESRSLGYSTTFSYNFASKYVFDFSYRTDASSSSGPDKPWTQSPSFGIRWNMQDEPFFKKINFISYSSMRASWGKSIIPNGTIYDIYGQYNTDLSTYNGQQSIAIGFNNLPNTTLKPTVNTQLNFGVDIGILKGKYSMSFDTYYKQSDNILRSKLIANHNGFLGANTNETSIVNYGYELSLNANILSEGKWKWNVSLNGAINKDVLAALPDNARQIISGGGGTNQPVVNKLGANALSNYLYHYAGVYTSIDDVPVDPVTGLRYRTAGALSQGRFFKEGDPIWTDINGDYILDDNDRVIVGNSQPRVTGGLSTSLRYEQFSLSTSVSFVIKRDILNNAAAERFQSFSDPLSQTALLPIDSYNYWSPENTNSQGYPNPYDYTRYNLYYPFRPDQTLFQEDGSYLKINNASLSYNLDPKFSKRFGVSSMRLFASANNIYTFSKYSGPNPESVSGLGRDSSGGYPNSRSYSLGLNVQF